MQECFEKIKERLEKTRYSDIYGGWETMRIDKAIEIVNQVAEEYGKDINVPGNDRWIPCSERLPDNGKRCWVTYEWANGTLHVDEDYLIDGKWLETKDEAVKAWMYNYVEKPEPYQPKGE